MCALVLMASCASRNEGSFHIAGTIEGADGKYAMVWPADANDVFHGDKPLAKIRIRKNSVDAFISLDSNSVYELLVPGYKGSSYAVHPVFADGKELHVTFSKGESRDQIFFVSSESPLNSFFTSYKEEKEKTLKDDMAEYHRLYDSLSRENTYFTEEYQKLFDQYNEASGAKVDSLTVLLRKLELGGEMLTKEGQAQDSLNNVIRKRRLDYDKSRLCRETPSQATFYLVVQAMKEALYLNHDVSFWLSHYDEVYKDNFSGCNLHNLAKTAMDEVKVYEGAHYQDFSLPDTEGNRVSLSSQIDGKVALLDLWASWCKPCRSNSRLMIPVYEKYRDAGFTVVGAAREYKGSEWRSALEQDAYPWVNLIALEEDHSVWTLYGLSNAAGGRFLIGKDGTILKINPTPEEVEAAILGNL